MIFHSLKQTFLALTILILFAGISQAQMRASEFQNLDYNHLTQEATGETNGHEPAEMFIPNAFTPNSDGINDTFSPSYIGEVSEYSLLIFDRTGRQVFGTNSLRQQWDGQIRGKSLQIGVYIFGMTYLDEEGQKQVRSGSITLLR